MNKDICEVVASLGHLDKLTICDAGLPIPDQIRRIDLAVCEGIPGFIEVTKAIAEDVVVQQIIIAEEIKEKSPHIEAQIREIFKGVDTVYVPHDQFKAMSCESRAIIRTGEFTPYANVILVSGVVF